MALEEPIEMARPDAEAGCKVIYVRAVECAVPRRRARTSRSTPQPLPPRPRAGRTGQTAGGTDNGKPGLRADYGPKYFAYRGMLKDSTLGPALDGERRRHDRLTSHIPHINRITGYQVKEKPCLIMSPLASPTSPAPRNSMTPR
jgi:hypothetical protein